MQVKYPEKRILIKQKVSEGINDFFLPVFYIFTQWMKLSQINLNLSWSLQSDI